MQGGCLARGVGVGSVASDAGDSRYWKPHLPMAGHNLGTETHLISFLVYLLSV